MLSTQVITLNYPLYSPTDAALQFFRYLPPLFLYFFACWKVLVLELHKLARQGLEGV